MRRRTNRREGFHTFYSHSVHLWRFLRVPDDPKGGTMKRRLVFVLALIGGLLLAACGGGAVPATSEATGAPAQPAPTSVPAQVAATSAPAPTSAPAQPAATSAPAQPAATSAPAASGEPVEITYMMWGSPEELAVWQKIVDDFQAAT